MLFPTTLVGSYPQPDWLIDRQRLAGRFPPRVRARELWRVAEPWLAQAQDDATLLAIRAQELAGLDIVTDGEVRRESYSNRFATALDGVDIDHPGTALDRSGHPNPVPRIVGPVRRRQPVEVDDVRFLRAHTGRLVKMTVPGPFTMSQQARNDYYPSEEAAALDYAAAVNAEIGDLLGLFLPARARRLPGPASLHRDGTVGPRLLGPGHAAGQDDHGGLSGPERHDDRDAGDGGRPGQTRAGSRVAGAGGPGPGLGMKYLPREVAFGKLAAMVAAARFLRKEYGGG